MPNAGISGHALLNLEGFLALGFLAAVCARRGKSALAVASRGRALPVLVAVCVIAAVAYARILTAPFVFDDYTHIADASRATGHTLLGAFGPVAIKPGLFFRPFGFVLYWLTYLWASQNATLWHASSIAFHALNSWLVYLLASRTGLGFAGSTCAALLFAVNPCAAETVAWVDARFDLMATGLVLLALWLVGGYLSSGRPWYLAAALIVAWGAVLTKESAFCLPALVAAAGFIRPKREVRRVWVATLWMALLCAAIFAYRWWALGGIGSYAGSQHPSLVHPANALFFRQWAILLFPVNWSVPVGYPLKAALALLVVVLAAISLRTSARRSQLLAGIAFVLAAAVPALQLLLIGTDLADARTLYLPSVGLALVWGLLLGAIDGRMRGVLVCMLLAIHTAILEHNLTPWRTVPELARATCESFGRQAALTAGAIPVCGLPVRRSGVPFLANGFAECVQMNSGVRAGRIQVEPGTSGCIPILVP